MDTTAIPEGTVTVVFTDVVGSTALTGRVGDEHARSLMREVEALVREQLGRHRGTEVKGTGDGQMLAFTSARRAVLCALDIQRALRGRPSGPALRIGLHTGEVVREEADLFGVAVNAAARISALAEAGEVLVSEATRSLLGPTSGLEMVDRGEHPLKGFDTPWRVFEARRASDEGPSSTGTVPLVAREAERTLLREALARARHGAGSIILLSGEPGIGKTRLATELMAEANVAGVAAALGRCYEMEGTPPFVAFAEAFDDLFRAVPADRLRACLGDQGAELARIVPRLRAQFGDLGPPAELPPEQARHYLFGCTTDVLARLAADRPLLLVLDDLHWADDSTCLLLEHLARRLPSMPLLVAGTYRDVDLDTSRPFAAALDRLTRETLARRIPVRRFDRAAVDGLLAVLAGKAAPALLVDAVFAETEGVPFFVLEVYRYLADAGRLFDERGDWHPANTLGEVEVPEGVRLVIGRRLERISAQTQGALALAAVIGHGFSFDLLRALTDTPEDALLDALEEAEHAHLIAETGSREAAYSFAHEQIRQTLLGTLSLPRRQRYHLRVADALEGTGDPAAQASAIAYHLYQAGAVADQERTTRFLALAGEQALAAGAFGEALRAFDQAVPLLPAGEPGRRARLLAGRGTAAAVVSGLNEALAGWGQAVDLYREAGMNDEAAELCYEVAIQLSWAERFEEQSSWAEQGLALARPDATALRGALRGLQALSLIWSSTPERADELIDECTAAATSHAGDVARPLTLALVCWEAACQFDLILANGQRAVRLAAEANRPYDVANNLYHYGAALSVTGALEQARGTLRECESASALAGNRMSRIYAAQIGQVLEASLNGDIQTVWANARILAASAEGLGWGGIIQCWAGHAAFFAGDLRAAEELYRKAYQADVVGRSDGFGWSALLRLLAYHDRRDELERLWFERRVALPVAGAINGPGSLWSLLHMVEAAAVVGKSVDWPTWDELLAAARPPRVVCVEYELWDAAAGIAAGRAGRWERAVEYFETALRLAHDLPHRIGQPEVRRWYAEMLLRRGEPGDHDKARGLLTEAIAMYRKIGMPWHADLAARMLGEV